MRLIGAESPKSEIETWSLDVVHDKHANDRGNDLGTRHGKGCKRTHRIEERCRSLLARKYSHRNKWTSSMISIPRRLLRRLLFVHFTCMSLALFVTSPCNASGRGYCARSSSGRSSRRCGIYMELGSATRGCAGEVK